MLKIIRRGRKAMGKADGSNRGTGTNYEESLEIVVGLYLIYYIFWHTKHLNSRFSQNEGGKMYTLYNDVLSIERGRFTRIKYGDYFRYSYAERKRMEDKFNIKFEDVKISLESGALAVTERQWLEYFETMREINKSMKTKNLSKKEIQGTKKDYKKVRSEMESLRNQIEKKELEKGQTDITQWEKEQKKRRDDIKQWEKEQKKRRDDIKELENEIEEAETKIVKLKENEIIKTVQKKLGEMMQKLEEDGYSSETPLYRIQYYLVHGERYEAKSSLEIAMEALEKVKPHDWLSMWKKEEERAIVKRYRDKLKKQYEFINALVYTYEVFEENI